MQILCNPLHKKAEYSRSIKELFKECKDLINNGAREIILLGQNVNAYNSNGKKLSHLIKEISKIDNLKELGILHHIQLISRTI